MCRGRRVTDVRREQTPETVLTMPTVRLGKGTHDVPGTTAQSALVGHSGLHWLGPPARGVLTVDRYAEAAVAAAVHAVPEPLVSAPAPFAAQLFTMSPVMVPRS